MGRRLLMTAVLCFPLFMFTQGIVELLKLHVTAGVLGVVTSALVLVAYILSVKIEKRLEEYRNGG